MEPTALVQPTIANPLPPLEGSLFCGIIGDRPSTSAKSPSIWNPVFRTLGIPATYLAFDVEAHRLGDVMTALRSSEGFLGGNVTMPYKIAIMQHLDDLDPKAREIGAVNTIVRTPDGKLIGYNTDGKGGLDCLTRHQPMQPAPFVESLEDRRVLVIGAGGAARSLGFYLAEAIGPKGRLSIVNREKERARDLAAAVHAVYQNTQAVEQIVPKEYDLLINASTVGQSGIRRLENGNVTCLEPFSPLAPAHPPELPAADAKDEPSFYEKWMRQARPSVDANNAASLQLLVDTPHDVRVFDIVHSPLETTLLRQARLTGHRTLNGKGMNVSQAAEGFFNCVCRTWLEDKHLWRPDTYQRILETMYSVW